MKKIRWIVSLSCILLLGIAVHPFFAVAQNRQQKSVDTEETSVSTPTLRYFPVTMYDYEETTINQATDRLDSDLTVREGIYFSDGSLEYTKRNEKITKGYEEWNRWDKAAGSNVQGQKFYTGLVEKVLDANKNIVFTKMEGGIFDSNAAVKKIYTNVELPFVYENGFYTFDASQYGVYFHKDDVQKSSAEAGNNSRLYFNSDAVQKNGVTYGDGSTTVWAPYNDGTNLSEADMNYHFGMQATIPFHMTQNGRINEADESSEAIRFTFSGDDDVWVFIDGKLVIDLGGIHNRLDAEIDFAENKVIYSKSNALNAATGSYNEPDFPLQQTLFENLILQDRESFAESESHELTIFYLERGKGSSNCRISFNLPVNDHVTVIKDATRSWYEAEGESSVVSTLTVEEQEIVDQIDFVFTLYAGIKNESEEIQYMPLSDTRYDLLNSNGQILANPSTDHKGRFTLKNGQSARFITSMIDEGAEFYVTEERTEGFIQPSYEYSGNAADGFLYNTEAYTDEEGKIFEAIMNEKYEDASEIPTYKVCDENGSSGKVTALGNRESEDSLTFVCLNYLDAKLPNPSVRPNDDKVVIDYGLPVEIDVLLNDVYRGDSIELQAVSGDGMQVNTDTGEMLQEAKDPLYGAVTIKDGKVLYTLEKQLTGVEILNYLVKVKSSISLEDGSVQDVFQWAVAKVYIIPATTMYYEEDFSDLVNYKTGNWEIVGRSETDYQEPGVVGTVDDSPYGSDQAYENDSGDSNGASGYVSTKKSAAQFEYTFTGTGTSFFVRTTEDSGYMRVVIRDEDGKIVNTTLRNTVYKVRGETLYNIPVFTYKAKNYGTYKVSVSIAKASSLYGSDFWLDGIRVVSPLSEEDPSVEIAKSSYALDSESNMTMATLREKLLTDVTQYDEEGRLIWSEKDETEQNFVLFTDSDGQMKNAQDYKSLGPKEEVYLRDGQRISFALTDWDVNGNRCFLGIKAPLGNASVTINGNLKELKNAADCYYDISNYAVIQTDADGSKRAVFEIVSQEDSLISVTNIKVTGNSEFSIVDGKTEEK